MRTQKAIISFQRRSDNELLVLARNIIEKMTDNTYFAEPSPEIKTVDKAADTYEEALAKCVNGTPEDTAVKNAAKDNLCSNLASLGNYVNSIASGDTVILDSSGFPLTKLPEPIGILPAPDYIHVTDGINHGTLNIEIGKVNKASGYLVLYTVSPEPESNNEWYSKIFSGRKGTITDLNRSTKYIIKAAALSSEAEKLNTYAFTDTAERITQ